MCELARLAIPFHQIKMEVRNPTASRAIGPNFGTSEREKSAAAMPLGTKPADASSVALSRPRPRNQ
jgi:hypothetical protein